MRYICIWLLFPIIVQAQELKFIDVPVYRQVSNEQSLLADILNHVGPDKQSGGIYRTSDRETSAHENTHGVNSTIRNHYASSAGKLQGLYLLGGKAVLLKEPRLRLNEVNPFVPASLRERSGKAFYLHAKEWQDRPTYLLDEWVAYTNGLLVAMEDKASGRHTRHDGTGAVELGLWSMALGMAVKEKDSGYWTGEPQFRLFLRYHWKRSKDAVNQDGKALIGLNDFMNLYLTGRDTERIRDFIIKEIESP